MEKINIGEELLNERGVRPHKNIKELSQTLETSEDKIPNWGTFNINEIADINLWTDNIITLKNIKTNKDWEKYISINWRKYYEYNWQWNPKDSMYVLKWNSLFIWDKFEWLTNRDGVSFRYSRWSWENISFYQHRTKYAWWIMHLKQIYKSENLLSSELIATVKYSWRIIRVTKNMLDKYMKWKLIKTDRDIIEAAIRLDPTVFAYIQELK